MSTRSLLILVMVSFVAIGCHKEETKKIINKGGLHSEMTDREILRAMKLVLQDMRAKKTDGPDGYSTTYSDGRYDVIITHSVASGLAVIRHTKATNTWQTWDLSEP